MSHRLSVAAIGEKPRFRFDAHVVRRKDRAVDRYSFRQPCLRWAAYSAIVLLTLSLSGCFFRSLIGFAGEDGTVSLSANLQAYICNYDPSLPPDFYGCRYSIFDDEGFLIETTSTFQLISEFGYAGIIIDPLIIQLPTDVTITDATYNNSGADLPLVLTVTNAIRVAPGQWISAEPGTTLAVVELPDTVAAAIDPGGEDFDFNLQLDAPPGQPVIVKMMLTASIDTEGTRYYLPLFPCVTDFSQVPDIQIPVGTSFQDLRPALGDLISQAESLVCDNQVYDFLPLTDRLFYDGFGF